MNLTFSRFFCFQPIFIESSLLKDIYNTPFVLENLRLDFLGISQNPDWVEKFKKTTNIYERLFFLNLGQIPLDELNNSLLSILCLQRNIFEIKKATTYLTINSISMDLMIVFDFEIVFFNDMVLQENNNNFYVAVRKIFVKDSDDDTTPIWLFEIKQKAITKAKEIINKILKKTTINGDTLVIKNNTGNITNITIHQSTTSTEEMKKMSYWFLICNNLVERVQGNSLKISLLTGNSEDLSQQKYDFYHFNGRAHTIFINDIKDISRYIPIQFHAQYMWHTTKTLIDSLKELSIDTFVELKGSDFKKSMKTMRNYINRIKMLTVFNEDFKFAIESDNDDIWRKIQSRWHIEEMLDNANRYADYLIGYLERTTEAARAKSDRIANKMLITISLLQILAITSVWNDYLSLLERDSSKISVFSKYRDFISNLNLYMPIGLIILILLSIILIILLTKKDK